MRKNPIHSDVLFILAIVDAFKYEIPLLLIQAQRFVTNQSNVKASQSRDLSRYLTSVRQVLKLS